jgi:CheY-like chemotaxis protein
MCTTDVFGPLTQSLTDYAHGIIKTRKAADRTLRDLAAFAGQHSLDLDRREDKVRLFRELHRLAVDGRPRNDGSPHAPSFTFSGPDVVALLARAGFSPREISDISGLSPVSIARTMRRKAQTGKRVFVIEDEYLLARELEVELEKEGFRVLGSAASEQAALAKTHGRDLDLIIADVTLRGRTSGIVAANRIRGGRDIPVIYLTGHSHMVTPLNISSRDCVLPKPLDRKAMFAAIDSRLDPDAAPRH